MPLGHRSGSETLTRRGSSSASSLPLRQVQLLDTSRPGTRPARRSPGLAHSRRPRRRLGHPIRRSRRPCAQGRPQRMATLRRPRPTGIRPLGRPRRLTQATNTRTEWRSECHQSEHRDRAHIGHICARGPRHTERRLRALIARRRGRCYVRCEAATGPSENTLGVLALTFQEARRFLFVDSLERNAAGKANYELLRTLAAERLTSYGSAIREHRQGSEDGSMRKLGILVALTTAAAVVGIAPAVAGAQTQPTPYVAAFCDAANRTDKAFAKLESGGKPKQKDIQALQKALG